VCASIGLNATDAKATATRQAAINDLPGSEIAGMLLEVGPDVTKSFKKGDRVYGFTHGTSFNKAEDGA
jgi:NADPH:quinone reductase-like Zn-dependent oxidoreductase